MRLVRWRHANSTCRLLLKVVLHGVSPLIWRLELRLRSSVFAVTWRLAEMLGEVFDTRLTDPPRGSGP